MKKSLHAHFLYKLIGYFYNIPQNSLLELETS